MKVFKMTAPEGYEWVLPVNDRDFDLLWFDGQPRASSWVPVRMRRLKVDDEGRPRMWSDCPSCSGGDMLMLRQNAFDKLGTVLRMYGEILPLNCPEASLWTLNITRLIDALDEDRSQLLRSPETGHILWVDNPVFRPEALECVHIFKLAQMPRGLIYVTTPFVDLVTAAGLRGITFKQVWAPN